MRTNPLHDTLLFLIGSTPDHDNLGWAKYVFVLLYAALLIGSVAVAVANWSSDPAQRTGRNVTLWLFRLLIGSMWFQGSLWKLPLPVSGGFQYWLGQTADNSFLPIHAALVRNIFVPNIAVVDPLVWLAETGMAVLIMLGLAVRLAGLGGMLLTVNLWIGLYLNGSEWPWNYVFLVIIHAFFLMDHAGRSLGVDAMLERSGWPTLDTLSARAWRVAS